MQAPFTFIAAFVVVLALIALAAWLVRRFAGNNISNSANRGRMPRLAVIDAAAVDGRRRLVLVRRDNVEHLLMIGGPTDVVVELNIVRAMPARDAAPQRPAGELPSRGAIPDAPAWNDGEGRPDDLDSLDPPAPEPAPTRSSRPAFVDELRRTQSMERRAPEPSPSTFSPEPPARGEPPARQEPRIENAPPRPPRADAPPRPSRLSETLGRIPRPPERATAPSPPSPAAMQAGAEQELTEMAQRLEAALRRPADATPVEPPAPSEPAPVPAPRPPRVTPPPPIAEVTMPTPLPAPPTPTQIRGFDNLEDEMASLLGRPKSS